MVIKGSKNCGSSLTFHGTLSRSERHDSKILIVFTFHLILYSIQSTVAFRVIELCLHIQRDEQKHKWRTTMACSKTGHHAWGWAHWSPRRTPSPTRSPKHGALAVCWAHWSPRRTPSPTRSPKHGALAARCRKLSWETFTESCQQFRAGRLSVAWDFLVSQIVVKLFPIVLFPLGYF